MRWNSNMLLRIAQGDAYCVATEYIKLPEEQETLDEALKFTGFVKRPGNSAFWPGVGRYTDDTQMSIANAEVLISGDFHSRLAFADAYIRCFWRDQRKGYARNFQSFLEGTKSGQEFLDMIVPDSEKNGAAMRSVPFGVLRDPKEVIEVTTLQAKLTHDTPGGTGAAVAVALLSHFALHSDDKLTKPNFLKWARQYETKYPLVKFIQAFDTDFPGPLVGPSVGLKTAHCALDIVTKNNTLLDMIRHAIVIGGDTDSSAAIALGIASHRIDESLPYFFEYCLEPGRLYGPAFLIKLGSDLMTKFSQ
jgi:ADP-ribosyl-[dinitrogen reductase] hydrolase